MYNYEMQLPRHIPGHMTVECERLRYRACIDLGAHHTTTELNLPTQQGLTNKPDFNFNRDSHYTI